MYGCLSVNHAKTAQCIWLKFCTHIVYDLAWDIGYFKLFIYYFLIFLVPWSPLGGEVAKSLPSSKVGPWELIYQLETMDRNIFHTLLEWLYLYNNQHEWNFFIEIPLSHIWYWNFPFSHILFWYVSDSTRSYNFFHYYN